MIYIIVLFWVDTFPPWLLWLSEVPILDAWSSCNSYLSYLRFYILNIIINPKGKQNYHIDWFHSLYLTWDENAQNQLTIFINHLTTKWLTKECWFTYVWEDITRTEVQRPQCEDRAFTGYWYSCIIIIIFIFQKYIYFFLIREDSCEQYVN